MGLVVAALGAIVLVMWLADDRKPTSELRPERQLITDVKPGDTVNVFDPSRPAKAAGSANAAPGDSPRELAPAPADDADQALAAPRLPADDAPAKPAQVAPPTAPKPIAPPLPADPPKPTPAPKPLPPPKPPAPPKPAAPAPDLYE